jgi:hypothetical protein
MHEESLIPNPLGIPADSNQLGNPLVLRFRSSHQFAAYSSANFGIEGALGTSTFSSAVRI